jgi:hypothetical protein
MGGKLPLGRPRRRREDNIKMELTVTEFARGRWNWLRIVSGGELWY